MNYVLRVDVGDGREDLLNCFSCVCLFKLAANIKLIEQFAASAQLSNKIDALLVLIKLVDLQYTRVIKTFEHVYFDLESLMFITIHLLLLKNLNCTNNI